MFIWSIFTFLNEANSIRFHRAGRVQHLNTSAPKKTPFRKLILWQNVFVKSGAPGKITPLKMKKYYYRKFWITFNLSVNQFKLPFMSRTQTDRFIADYTEWYFVKEWLILCHSLESKLQISLQQQETQVPILALHHTGFISSKNKRLKVVKQLIKKGVKIVKCKLLQNPKIKGIIKTCRGSGQWQFASYFKTQQLRAIIQYYLSMKHHDSEV